MLKNKTNSDLKLKYNGKVIVVPKGKGIDIRDFDVANKDVLAAEKHIMSKYPDIYEQTKTTGDPDRDVALKEEIEELQQQNQALKKELDAQRKTNDNLTQKHQGHVGEVQSLKQQLESLKTENSELKATFKDMESEIEGLRKEVSTGKTAGKK